MSQGNIQLDDQRIEKSEELYKNLRSAQALGSDFTYDNFLDWVNQYKRVSREFHGLDHLLAMSELNRDLPGRAGIYSMVAGFFHDEDYPSIAEGITPVSQRFIDKYVEVRDGKKYVKALEEGDIAGQILHGVFGFMPGQELLPFPVIKDGKVLNPGGVNEFYSAAAAAGEMAELGRDTRLITAVIAGIEATIPFRSPSRMNDLRSRVETVNKEVLNSKLTGQDIEEIMISAVHTANKDVTSFLGGLNPEKDTSPTVSSVVNTIWGGDMLSPEEVAALRMKGRPRGSGPGNYTPHDFLTARLKRAGLYQLVIPGDDVKETISNLFYEVKLADGVNKYPQNGWTEKANHLAYLNNKPVRLAEFARLISSGIIYSIAAQGGETTDPKKVTLSDLLSGVIQRMPVHRPKPGSSDMNLAFECVSGRSQTPGGSDTRRSPLAELVLAKLDETQLKSLALEARRHLLSKPPSPTEPNPAEFLKVATEYLGEVVGTVKDEMITSANLSGKHVMAATLRGIQLPAVQRSGPAG